MKEEFLVEYKKRPTVEELKRPARIQSDGSNQKNLAYREGSEQYNIWYGKYQYDYDKRGKMTSKTKCDPKNDIGWTKADFDSNSNYFCIYFAKGSCVNGSKCKFYHRIPTEEDDKLISPMYDIFGRERHAQHKDDMSGTGSFNKECRTIFIGDLFINRSNDNYLDNVNKIIKKEFSIWGPVEYIRIIPNKNIAFIRYYYRSSAEFAKAAMENQIIFKDQTEPIIVRWAYDDPNPISVETNKKRNTSEVENIVNLSELNKKSKVKIDSADNEITYEGIKLDKEGFYDHINNDYNILINKNYNQQRDYTRVEQILQNIKTNYDRLNNKVDKDELDEERNKEDSSIFDVKF